MQPMVPRMPATPWKPVPQGIPERPAAPSQPAGMGFGERKFGIAPSRFVHAAQPLVDQEVQAWEFARINPLRVAGQFIALLFLFTRYSNIHEVMAAKIGTNFYVMVWSGGLSILFCLISGGFSYVLKTPIGRWWAGFAIFMIASAPFSFWPGQSLHEMMTYMKTSWIVLPLVAGLFMTWDEVWSYLNWLGLAAMIDVALGFLMRTGSDRLELDGGGTMSNSNDYAALLCQMAPILLMVVFTAGRSIVVRILALGCAGASLYLILATASRGALIAIVVSILFCVLRLPPAGKVAIVVLGIGGLLGAFTVLPATVSGRLLSIFSSTPTADSGDAEASAGQRRYLLQKSIEFTITHPLLGVGMGEFSDVEGVSARAIGEKGAWHETHNAYTQISSELGVPALICFLGAMGMTFFSFSRTYKRARQETANATDPAVKKRNQRMVLASFCLLVSLVGFCASIFFLSLAYTYYLPGFSGLALAFSRATEMEWRKDRANATAPPPLPASPWPQRAFS